MTDMKKLIESVDRMTEAPDESQFPEYMGGYMPPFNTEGNSVVDKNNNAVLKCKNIYFSRVVKMALNQYCEDN